jgi:hypothetical protein
MLKRFCKAAWMGYRGMAISRSHGCGIKKNPLSMDRIFLEEMDVLAMDKSFFGDFFKRQSALDERSRAVQFPVANVFRRGIMTTSRSTCFRSAHRLPPCWLLHSKRDETAMSKKFGQWTSGHAGQSNIRAGVLI